MLNRDVHMMIKAAARPNATVASPRSCSNILGAVVNINTETKAEVNCKKNVEKDKKM